MCAPQVIQGDSPIPQQAEDRGGKEASIEQLEVATDEPEAATRLTGVWKKFKQRLQRNTQDIKLVSGVVLIL